MLIRGTCWTRGCELRQRDISEKTGVCWLLLFAKIAALRHTYKKDQKGISVIKERRQHNRSKACEENQNTEILTTRQWAKRKPWSAKQKFPRFATAVSRVGCIISPSNCKTPIPVHLLRRRALRHKKHQPCLAMPGIKPRWINILPYPATEGFNAWTWCVYWIWRRNHRGLSSVAWHFHVHQVLLHSVCWWFCWKHPFSWFASARRQISSFSWAIVWVSSKVMYLRLGCWASPKSHVHQLLARTLSTDPFSLRKAHFLQKWIVMRCYDKTGKEGRWSDEEASDQQKKGSNRDMNETKTKAGKRWNFSSPIWGSYFQSRGGRSQNLQVCRGGMSQGVAGECRGKRVQN